MSVTIKFRFALLLRYPERINFRAIHGPVFLPKYVVDVSLQSKAQPINKYA